VTAQSGPAIKLAESVASPVTTVGSGGLKPGHGSVRRRRNVKSKTNGNSNTNGDGNGNGNGNGKT
jgi:hypothetical protein